MNRHVSTHAPAGGATHLEVLVKQLLMFQPTHLREVRLVECLFCSTKLSFNPRTCGRCDVLLDKDIIYASVSTHAPAGGATYNGPLIDNELWFQPTHLREVRQKSNKVYIT